MVLPDGPNIVFIGGGRAMLDSAVIARDLGYEARVFLSPAHAAERIESDRHLASLLESADVQFDVCQNPEEINLSSLLGSPALAVCYGPRWVFSPEVRAKFELGMVNVNLIPVPRFLGGAHFSWQILTGSDQLGFTVQEITEDLDRGPVLYQVLERVSKASPGLLDFFEAVEALNKREFRRVLPGLVDGTAWKDPVGFETLASERLYFPRLVANIHGWVDWSWTAEEIVRFCRAFDDPYDGAITYSSEDVVALKAVQATDQQFLASHPFMAGMVVRTVGDSALVAARDGFLEVGDVRLPTGHRHVLAEGNRLFTPASLLEKAKTQRISTSFLEETTLLLRNIPNEGGFQH